MSKKVKWECPKCSTGAPGEGHGKGDCHDDPDGESCYGFVCECDGDEEHGDSLENPCENAACYHCGWASRFPPLPKKLRPWEKRALEAGWKPPEGWDT